MNFTIHQLYIFKKVVELKSISKSAEELYLTQPAISLQLKKFQEQFSIPLFEYQGRQIIITDFGHELYNSVCQLLEEIENIKYKTKEYEGALKGKLTISSASNGKYVVPYFLTEFLEKHPGIDITLDVTNRDKVLEDLYNKKTDFAVISLLPKNKKDLNEEILVRNDLYLISFSKKFDESKPLIFREQGSATRMLMEKFFHKNSKHNRKVLELTSNEAIKQAILAGMGHSLLPLFGLKNEILDGSLYVIKKKGLPITTYWRLVWLKDKKLSPLAQNFISYIQKNKSKIIKKHFQWYLNFKP